MKKLLLCLIVMQSFNAFSMCDIDAKKMAEAYVAGSYEISVKDVEAEISYNGFDETYGKGDYLLKIIDKNEKNLLMELIIEMVAYSNEDDPVLTCEAVDIYIP